MNLISKSTVPQSFTFTEVEMSWNPDFEIIRSFTPLFQTNSQGEISHKYSSSAVTTLKGGVAMMFTVPLFKYIPQRKIKNAPSIARPITTASAIVLFLSRSIRYFLCG